MQTVAQVALGHLQGCLEQEQHPQAVTETCCHTCSQGDVLRHSRTLSP